MPIDVSVVIPVLNDEERLAICLDSIEKQNTHYSYEVIVVDNGSLNPPVSLIKKYSFAKLLFEIKEGSYCARNSGLKHAKGDIIAFTDSDCIVHCDWIENAMMAFANKKCDMIGGKIILSYKNPSKLTSTELYDTFFAFQQK